MKSVDYISWGELVHPKNYSLDDSGDGQESVSYLSYFS